jgi:tetratricopeptide (TPR) repeat protein
MKILRSVAFVLALLVLAGCSKSEPKPPPSAGTVAPRPAFNAVSDIPAELRADLDSFARQFETASREGDTNAIRRTFDLAAISDDVCEGIQANEATLDKFKSGFKNGMLRSVSQLSAGWAQNNAKYKGVALYKGSPATRFRFVSDDSGIAIMDLVVRKNAQGEVRIVNLYNHAMGYDMVEQSRQMIAPMLGDLDQSFLQRLINKPNASQDDIKRFGELAKLIARRDFAGVVSTYDQLSPTMKETLPATGMYLTALQALGDDNKYKQALKDAGTRFKSASFQFMLVDAHFLDKEYDKAIECIDSFMTAVEKDAALLTLKSLMFHAKGDAKNAQTVLREAIKLEPDCLFAHSKGLDVLLAAKDYAGVRDSMIFLEEKGGLRFKGAMDDPLWDDFKKAPESKQWR